MSKKLKSITLFSIVVATCALFVLKFMEDRECETMGPFSCVENSPGATVGIPRLLELGSSTCVPCKMMEGVLDSLRDGYPGQLRVDFIDVTIFPETGKKYRIQLIPTQILFDGHGKEIFRHEGFFPEKDIVAKFVEFGIGLNLEKSTRSTSVSTGVAATLFSSLSSALAGSVFIALSASFVWGVLSILLSPCHLASIPLVVGFINDQHEMTTKRAFVLAFLFASGILATIAIVGVATAAIGRMLGDMGGWTNYIVSLVFILIGLHLLDVLPMPWDGPGQVGMKKKGGVAAFVLGLIFGAAIGPCTFAYMAPMLAVAFKASAESMEYGVVLLLFYGLGHCSVIVFAGTFTEWIQKYLQWNEKSKGAVILKKLCAVLVIVGGWYMIYNA